MAFSPSTSPSVSSDSGALQDAYAQLVLLTRRQAEQARTGWLPTFGGRELIVTQDTQSLLQALLAEAGPEGPDDEALLLMGPTCDALRCGELRRGEGVAPLALQWAWALPLVQLVQAGNGALRQGLV